MSRFLLDTNIISEFAKPAPSRLLEDWLGEQVDDDLFISSMTLAKIQQGILGMPAGRKRGKLEAWFSGPDGPSALFAGRVLAFDAAAALEWAKLMTTGRNSGKPRSPLDMIIAATAAANQCVVATANEKDFAGLKFINPLKAASGRG